jgi:hypothetical protein
MGKSSNNLGTPNRNFSPNNSQQYSRATMEQINGKVYRDVRPNNSALRICYSQPKICRLPNQPTINTNRPTTPNVVNCITPQRVFYQNPQPINYQSFQSTLFQTQQFPTTSTLKRSSHHMNQTQPINSTKI